MSHIIDEIATLTSRSLQEARLKNQSVVLVVEDGECIRDLMQRLLEDFLGVQTVPAEDGVQALDLVSQVMPELVLLDIMLPRLDGFEVARRLKANPATMHIPIIAVTAGASRDQVLAAGCDDFVEKPFDVHYFLKKVQRHLLAQTPV